MRPVAFVWLMVAFCGAQVFAAGGDIPVGKPVPVSTNWPTGLKEVVDRPNRVHGFSVNTENVFFYSGDVGAFNEFMSRCVIVPGVVSQKLNLRRGIGVARSPWNNNGGVRCDWSIRITPRPLRPPIQLDPTLPPVPANTNRTCTVELDLWTDGNVDVTKLQIPAGVRINLGDGYPNAPIPGYRPR
jgi:hypothetical protein